MFIGDISQGFALGYRIAAFQAFQNLAFAAAPEAGSGEQKTLL